VTNPALAEDRLTAIAALERPAKTKRMLVIVNPYATTMSDRLKHLVVYALAGRYDVEAIETERRGHATELIAAAIGDEFDVVVAFGGDGTVNEIANGLAGSGTPLTVLPGGSNNVFAKMLGIPNDVVDATEHLLRLADRWEPRAVDLGRLNGRRFTFAAGVGLDASVVERVDGHPHLKARYGAWYYTAAAVVTFLRRYVVNPPRLEIETGGRRVRGVSAFFQNGDTYTYFKSRPVHLVEGAQLDSGDLAGVMLTRARPYDVPTVTVRALSGAARIAKHRGIAAFSGIHEARIRSVDGRPVPLQVDGDHIGDEIEAELTVEPGGLRVVC
jgi:diacylglycerol kinase family enzyme